MPPLTAPSSRLGEPPASYYSGKTLDEYLRLWAAHLATKAGAGDVLTVSSICVDVGAARGYVVSTSSGRMFILDCDTGQTWAELVDTGGGELPSNPAPKPAAPSDADVLAALANTHLFLDPTIAAPQVRPGPCPSERVRRTLPGSDIAVCTPEATFLYRAPKAGLTAPVLAWGDHPPAGFQSAGAWGNSTLYEAPPGLPLASLPQSRATFTVEAITRAPGSPLVLTGAGVRVNLAKFRAHPQNDMAKFRPQQDEQPAEDKPAAPPSRTGLIVGGLLAALAGLAWWKPWRK